MTELKNYKGKLELNWINKDKSIFYEINEEKCTGINPIWVEKNDIRVTEPRILRLIKTYGDLKNENMLIKGDNLLALRTLVKIFKNRTENDRIKYIYIDPPYNTGSAFEYLLEKKPKNLDEELIEDTSIKISKKLNTKDLIEKAEFTGFPEKFSLNNFITNDNIKQNALKISDDSISVEVCNLEQIKSKIQGRNVYKINISLNEKYIEHDCLDYLKRRKNEKQFCKHIVKLLLYLEINQNKDFIQYIFDSIGNDLKNWTFK